MSNLAVNHAAFTTYRTPGEEAASSDTEMDAAATPTETPRLPLLPRQSWTAQYLSNPAIMERCLTHDATRVITVLSRTATETVQQQQQLANSATSNTANTEALIARIAALETQLTRNTPSPSLPRRSAKVPAPSFDGKPENLRPFIANLINKMGLNDDHFATELDKVGFAYQCLSGTAADKLRSHFRHLFDFDSEPEVKTLERFVGLLNRYFKDAAAQQKADTKLDGLSQENRSFIDFLTEFEDTICESSFASHDRSDVWINFLIPKLSEELHNAYVNADNAPTSYEAFTEFLREKDTKIQARRATRPTREVAPPQTSQTSRQDVSYTPRRYPLPETSTSLTVSQGGTKMDLDAQSRAKGPDGRLTEAAKSARRSLGRCLRCNGNGHFADACPLKRQVGTSIWAEEQEVTGSIEEDLRDSL